MSRYDLLIETSDTDALHTALTLFTNVHAAPARDAGGFTEITFDADDDALNAYLDHFGLARDERDDVFTPVD